MNKYEPLWKHFQNKKEPIINLSFDEIKKILGFTMDHSFLNYKKELEAYGYRVEKISLKEKRVMFERIKIRT